MPDQFQGNTMKIEIVEASPDHSPIFKDIAARVIAIPIEATLDHNTGIDAATTGADHDDLTQHIEATAIDLTATHHIVHIAHHPHIEVLQVINP